MAGTPEAGGRTNGIGTGLNKGAVAAEAGATGSSTVEVGGGIVIISGASGSFALEA